ncbi:MAG: sigma 54-interacting transcriptional regulator [Candidatus Marinimicrobia bacterium]|nr:sigma 54-interacting transcriptional regulator [Candidatus Neomarinimicrobiota bacterium]
MTDLDLNKLDAEKLYNIAEHENFDDDLLANILSRIDDDKNYKLFKRFKHNKIKLGSISSKSMIYSLPKEQVYEFYFSEVIDKTLFTGSVTSYLLKNLNIGQGFDVFMDNLERIFNREIIIPYNLYEKYMQTLFNPKNDLKNFSKFSSLDLYNEIYTGSADKYEFYIDWDDSVLKTEDNFSQEEIKLVKIFKNKFDFPTNSYIMVPILKGIQETKKINSNIMIVGGGELESQKIVEVVAKLNNLYNNIIHIDKNLTTDELTTNKEGIIYIPNMDQKYKKNNEQINDLLETVLYKNYDYRIIGHFSYEFYWSSVLGLGNKVSRFFNSQIFIPPLQTRPIDKLTKAKYYLTKRLKKLGVRTSGIKLESFKPLLSVVIGNDEIREIVESLGNYLLKPNNDHNIIDAKDTYINENIYKTILYYKSILFIDYRDFSPDLTFDSIFHAKKEEYDYLTDFIFQFIENPDLMKNTNGGSHQNITAKVIDPSYFQKNEPKKRPPKPSEETDIFQWMYLYQVAKKDPLFFKFILANVIEFLPKIDEEMFNIQKLFIGYGFITRDVKMINILKEVKELAETDRHIFLYGETGTGKNLLPQAIHEISQRNNGEFKKINCAAISEQLLESELFGYEKGAHSKADEPKEGFIEQCNGGTLFLDEIHNMSIDHQNKLLRFLDTGKFRRIGGNKILEKDVRVIAAVNEPIDDLIEKNTLKKDLAARLNYKNKISLPPLRERSVDIPYLAEYFFTQTLRKKYGKLIPPTRLEYKTHPIYYLIKLNMLFLIDINDTEINADLFFHEDVIHDFIDNSKLTKEQITQINFLLTFMKNRNKPMLVNDVIQYKDYLFKYLSEDYSDGNIRSLENDVKTDAEKAVNNKNLDQYLSNRSLKILNFIDNNKNRLLGDEDINRIQNYLDNNLNRKKTVNEDSIGYDTFHMHERGIYIKIYCEAYHLYGIENIKRGSRQYTFYKNLLNEINQISKVVFDFDKFINTDLYDYVKGIIIKITESQELFKKYDDSIELDELLKIFPNELFDKFKDMLINSYYESRSFPLYIKRYIKILFELYINKNSDTDTDKEKEYEESKFKDITNECINTVENIISKHKNSNDKWLKNNLHKEDRVHYLEKIIECKQKYQI